MDLHVEIATPVKIAQNEGSAALDSVKEMVFGSVISLFGAYGPNPALTLTNALNCRLPAC